MERAVTALIRMALTTALMTGGGLALQQLVFEAQQSSKQAMKMGISYSKFNRMLLRKPKAFEVSK